MDVIRFSRFLLFSWLLVITAPAFAVETIDWQSLVPAVDESLDPYPRLTEDEQNSLYDLWMVRETRAVGGSTEQMDQLERDAVAILEAGGNDPAAVLQELDAFVAMLEANKTRLVEELDGKHIRMPGYVLPTEFSGNEIVEFLLVPYVGACVHTPAPPLNQLVHVKVDKGFTSEGLFAPVWVTGQINTALQTQSISFTDGSMDVESGYRIKASEIIPYE